MGQADLEHAQEHDAEYKGNPLDDAKFFAHATTHDDALPPEAPAAPTLARKLSARQVQMIAMYRWGDFTYPQGCSTNSSI